MTNPTELNAAIADERRLWGELRGAQLDIEIAKRRDGDVAAAQAQAAGASTAWWQARNRAHALARALVTELGIDAEGMRVALAA